MKDYVLSLLTGKGLIIYYAFLLVVMMSWTDFNNFPPMILRLAYMGLVFLPTFIDRNSIMPATLTCFWLLAINGYAYSYMPTMEYLYLAILAFAYPFVRRSSKQAMSYRGFYVTILLFSFMFIRDLIGDMEVQKSTLCLSVIILLPLFVDFWDTKSTEKMAIAFMTMSLVLSYFSFTTQALFTGTYGSFNGEDRSAWADPNYLSMTMGFGAVIAFSFLLRFKSLNIFTKVLSIASFVTTIPAMLLLASRGGMLCVIVSIVILLMFSKASRVFKGFVLVAAIGFIIFLYTNSFFDIIEDRINNADGTGSERTLIWENRLTAFANSENPLYWLFGYSYHGGLKLGLPYEFGSHNDYIAFLAEYGLLGLGLILSFLALPLLNMKRNSKSAIEVVAFLSYLALSCATLEPFSLGRPAFYLFWFYILLLARVSYVKYSKKHILQEAISRLNLKNLAINKVKQNE